MRNNLKQAYCSVFEYVQSLRVIIGISNILLPQIIDHVNILQKLPSLGSMAQSALLLQS